jgi:hypothetical protein
MQIKDVITKLIKEFNISPQQINNGECDQFAVEIGILFPESDELCSEVVGIFEPRHIWIEYKGKHYDAETPNGVSDYKKLPIFKNSKIKYL